MILLGIVAVSFAPGIFFLWYFYRKDKLEPEPKSLVIKTYLAGMVAVIPVGLLEMPFFSEWFLMLVLIAPVVEELAKFLTVRLTIYRSEEFNEPMDGIVYGAAAALGFASVENALYVGTAYYSPEELAFFPDDAGAAMAVLSVFTLRALLAVPGHAVWSSMWGYALGRAKFEADRWRALRFILSGLVLAVAFHSLHNFLSFHSATFGLFGLIVLALVLWRLVASNIKSALAESPFNPDNIQPSLSGDAPDSLDP